MSEYGWDSYGADYGDDWAERQAEETHRMQARRMSCQYGEPQAPDYPDALRGISGHSRIDDPDGEHYYDYDPPPRGTDPDGLGRLRNWMSRHNTERVQDPRAEEYNDGARSVKREPPTLDAGTAQDVLRIENRHSRVTEFRREWRDTGGTSQVRVVW